MRETLVAYTMRILHVSHLYYPSVGGNQIQNQGLSETLAGWGDEVAVFTTNALLPKQLTQHDRGYKPLPERETIHGVQVRRFAPYYRVRRVFVKSSGLICRGAHQVGARRFGARLDLLRSRGPLVPQMVRAIRGYGPEVIQAHGGYPATTYFSYLARKWYGFPLVIRPTTHVAQGWHKHPFQLEMYRVADRLIVSTAFERRVLVEQGVPEEKTVLIGNGMDAGPFLEADGAAFRQVHGIGAAKVVGFVGRKTAGKGAEHLIEAMELVWQEMPGVCLVMAGQQDSAYAADIKERLERVREEHAGMVVDIDDFSEAEKPAIYAACDVFAMPSNTDSFGIVYLEAWASGKPVIACRGTAQETIIDQEEDGLLVGYGEPRELAQAIVRLLGDDGLRSRLGENGRRKVLGNYTWEIVARKVREVYRELVEAKC